MLSAESLLRWASALAPRLPYLLSAYLVPGRVSPRIREATMLGVTSINRCQACDRVHQRWARTVGLTAVDPSRFAPDEAAAYTYGQDVAVGGPRSVAPPSTMSTPHGRELEAAACLMELANLAGNRFLPEGRNARRLLIDGPALARGYDLAMRGADRAGVGRARRRIAGAAAGDVLEIGIGTGLNLGHYAQAATIHGIDPSPAALEIATARAAELERTLAVSAGEAERLPHPDGSFDVVVGTFVLCSVGDVAEALAESRRVLRPGGTVRFLEHSRSRHRPVARLQTAFAPAWARMAGGCRLDHDVLGAVEHAGFRIVESRSRVGGLLVEIVASA